MTLVSDDARPVRRYLLLVSRKQYPFVQQLWAESRWEAIAARQELLLDPVVRNVKAFFPVKDERLT